MTSYDEEPEKWVLTEKESQQVIDFHIEQTKKWLIWKGINRGLSQEQILKKIAKINWDKHLKNEKQEILRKANSNKLQLEWQKQYQLQQRNKEIQEQFAKKIALQKKYPAKYFYNLMKYTALNVYGKEKFIEEPKSMLPLIKTICYFFSGDERFETELGYDLNKGLWIRGIAGIGKTFLIECIQHNELSPVSIFSMLTILKVVKNDGDFTDERLYTAPKIYIDDVGSEISSVITHYGTDINWFKDFIELYYAEKRSFTRLIVSTNNNHDEIEEKYGFRVRSRMKDMFNIVNVTHAKDLRGTKS